MRSVGWVLLGGHVKPTPGTPTDQNSKKSSWNAFLLNACDLALGFRELNWQGPRKPERLLQARPVQSRTQFLKVAALSFILHLVLCDFLQFGVQSVAPDTIGAPIGGSIFDPLLPPVKRYLRSTAISLLFGTSIYTITHAFYDATSVFGVALLRQSPDQWPPLFDSPWRSTSLRELWGDRWHHLNRNYMMTTAVNPMKRVVGGSGGVLAAFTLSGLMHDVGLRAVGRGSDFFAVVGFFFLMGAGVILESVWSRMAKTKVSGVYGWLWTFGWVLLWANNLVNAWLVRGGAAGSVVPGPFRPSKLVVSFACYLFGTFVQ
ncbi:hypothetical protein HYDPIDRAFT_85404 [Hydnomerulius pinastri MD-312]|nr:hypothetical protein HYDPIDRAFT_85404 [Hydnomerulius pinastri MD-312]